MVNLWWLLLFRFRLLLVFFFGTAITSRILPRWQNICQFCYNSAALETPLKTEQNIIGKLFDSSFALPQELMPISVGLASRMLEEAGSGCDASGLLLGALMACDQQCVSRFGRNVCNDFHAAVLLQLLQKAFPLLLWQKPDTGVSFPFGRTLTAGGGRALQLSGTLQFGTNARANMVRSGWSHGLAISACCARIPKGGRYRGIVLDDRIASLVSFANDETPNIPEIMNLGLCLGAFC